MSKQKQKRMSPMKMQSRMKLELSDFEEWGFVARESSLKSGWLVKQGKENIRSFKRRFFVLDGCMLFYYDSEDPDSVIGAILVEAATVAELEKQFTNTSSPYVFQIVTRSGRSINLGAESENERNEWVAAIRASGTTRHTDLQKAEREISKLRAELQRACVDRTKLRAALSSTTQASNHLTQALKLMNSACPPTPNSSHSSPSRSHLSRQPHSTKRSPNQSHSQPPSGWNRATISGVNPRSLKFENLPEEVGGTSSSGNGDSFSTERATLPAGHKVNGR